MSHNYRFDVLGPFRVWSMRRSRPRHVDAEFSRDDVFEAAQKVVGADYDIRKAIGCYLFGIYPPGGPQSPYFVGKACEETLYETVFQSPSPRRIYNQALRQFKSVTPFVYLLPLISLGTRRARLKSNRKIVDWAEQQLIGMALRVNPDLWDVQHRMGLQSFTIDGISKAPGKLSGSAQRFRAMIDRPPPKEMRATAPG